MNILTRRMHSSRMRTGRSLTVCCSLLPGGVCAWSGGVFALGVSSCAPGGCAWSRGSVCSGGVSAPWGCLLRGGVCSGGSAPGGGVCLVKGGYLSMH